MFKIQNILNLNEWGLDLKLRINLAFQDALHLNLFAIFKTNLQVKE